MSSLKNIKGCETSFQATLSLLSSLSLLFFYIFCYTLVEFKSIYSVYFTDTTTDKLKWKKKLYISENCSKQR